MFHVMQRVLQSGRSFFTSFVRMVEVVPVGALSDNYMYILVDEKTRKAAVVDPVDVKAVSCPASS